MIGIKGLGALTMGGAVIITSVFICILGYSTFAAAGDSKCFMAVKKYEAALEKLMKENQRVQPKLKQAYDMVKKSAKKYDSAQGMMEGFMKDKDISKSEAEKISKMRLKFKALDKKYSELYTLLQTGVLPMIENVVKYKLKFLKACD